MMPLALDSFGGVGNNPWNKPVSPTYPFDASTPAFKTGDPLDDSVSSSSGEKGDRQNPSRYKTELCRPFEENGACKYGEKCQFAHGRSELRGLNRHPKYKTELCRTFHTTGICPYGPRCHFLHAEALDSSAPSSLKRVDAADCGIPLNNNNNNYHNNNKLAGVVQAKNVHQSFASRNNGANVGNGVINNFITDTRLSSSATQRPSNLNLSLCLNNNNNNNGAMTSEGETSPPSISSSTYSGCSPLIPSFSSSASGVWGPSPAPMSPSSSVSSFSTSSSFSSSSCSSSSSSYFSDGGSVLDRPSSPTAGTFLNVPARVKGSAPFSAPPPVPPTASSFPGLEHRDRGRIGDSSSPSPALYPRDSSFQGPKSPSESALNPAAEVWSGGSRCDAFANGVGGWRDIEHAMKGSTQQSRPHKQPDLLNGLGISANFDQLSKMIVNELLERLKEMIAGQMNGAPPQIQQQALLEQIQVLLSGGSAGGGGGGGGGGSTTTAGSVEDDACVSKSLRGGWRDRWTTGSGGSVDSGESLYQMFDRDGNAPPALSSKRGDYSSPRDDAASAPSVPDAVFPLDPPHPGPFTAAKASAQTPSACDADDQEAPVRLPIFSQLTK